MEEIKLAEKFNALMRETEDYIWNNPETGYKEFKTDAFLKRKMFELGYEIIAPEDITGFIAVADTGKPGPTVVFFAELDSVICSTHPECDKKTGAVHACGHNNQCAVLVGFAAMLKEKGSLEGLCGKIKLCFVPAEEGIELDYRRDLCEKGLIKYFSGKQEFIYRGLLDDADIACMIHANNIESDGIKFHLDFGHNGLIRKITVFKGKSSHAGGYPERGINALNTAACAISVANNLRETFKEKDYVRFHYIITHGGDVVNAIPDEVRLESYVRASNPAAMKAVNAKINRAFAGVACSFGSNVHQTDIPGSEAVCPDEKLKDVAFESLVKIVGKEKCERSTEWSASSTDFGDVSLLVPSVLVYSHCATGNFHGSDYKMTDYEVGETESAAFLLCFSRELLKNDAAKAKEVIKNFKPVFATKKDYFEYKDSLNKDKDLLVYNQDGTVTVYD